MEESWLCTAPVEAVHDWLLAIKGIGAFSASFMLIRELERIELLSSIEKPLKRVVAKHYGHLAVEAVAERYGDYRGYWAHYLRVGG